MQRVVFLFFFYFVIINLCFYNENGSSMAYNLDVQIGSNCTTNGLNGTCTSLTNCLSAQDAILNRHHPSICSFQGMMPVVCCTTQIANKKIDGMEIPTTSSQLKPRRKAEEQCLHYLKTLDYTCPSKFNFVRNGGDSVLDVTTPSEESQGSSDDVNMSPFGIPPIALGRPALRNQYPHMALLGYEDTEHTTQWLCGGSVISEKFVLTAAHCISSPIVGPVKYAAFGILKRSDPSDYWQVHNVARVIRHPEYHAPHKYHDIALLETEREIYFDKDVRPACLDVKPEPDFYAEATGWGALGHNQALADTLQTVTLRRFDAKTCSELYPKHRHLLHGFDDATQMCYGHEEDPRDTCQGDSGGPLQVKDEHKCSYTIVGVTSYGRACGKTAGSGIYTRVSHYVPWIESIVWPEP